MTSIADDSDPKLENMGRTKRLLFFSVTVFGIGQSLLFVLMGPLARDMGLTESQFGLIFTLSNLGLLISGPYWGKKSDSAGRKDILLVGLLGTFVGTFLLALAIQVGLWKTLPIWQLIFLLFLTRAIYSLTATAIYPSSGAYMADITSHKDRGKGMALIGGANSMGAILGPVIGGGLAFIHVLFPMYLASAIALVGAFTIYKYLPESPRGKSSSAVTSLKPNDKRILPFMIVWIAFFLAFTTTQFVTAFYIQDRLGLTDSQDVIQTASIVMGALAVTNVTIQVGLMQKFHIHPRTMLRLCLPLFAVAFLIIGFATTLPVLIGGYVFMGFAFSMANPGINGSASLSVEPHEQGTASGLLAGATTFGVVLGPILGTSLYEYQINLPMLFGAALALIVGIYTWTIKVPDPKKPEIV